MKTNKIKNFNNNIYKIHSCPLCNNNKKNKLGYSDKNLYSEILAKMFKIEEKIILRKIINVKCIKCGLVYKNYWFKKNILKKLFSKEIPIHPKGNDIYEKKFTKKYFIKEYKNFKKNYKINIYNFNKSKRIIVSIINAIDSDKKILSKTISMLESKNINFEETSKNIILISKLINNPKRFSRFVGYKDIYLWKFILSKFENIINYGEVGCPAWGMLEIAKKYKKKIFFYNRKESNFWNEENSCLKNTNLKKNQIINNFNKSKIISLMGIIEYLDHIENPLEFMHKISSKCKNFYIILNNSKKDKVAIQHFTGWNDKSIEFLSIKLNKKVKIYENYFGKKNMILAIF